MTPLDDRRHGQLRRRGAWGGLPLTPPWGPGRSRPEEGHHREASECRSKRDQDHRRAHRDSAGDPRPDREEVCLTSSLQKVPPPRGCKFSGGEENWPSVFATPVVPTRERPGAPWCRNLSPIPIRLQLLRERANDRGSSLRRSRLRNLFHRRAPRGWAFPPHGRAWSRSCLWTALRRRAWSNSSLLHFDDADDIPRAGCFQDVGRKAFEVGGDRPTIRNGKPTSQRTQSGPCSSGSRRGLAPSLSPTRPD